MCGNDVADIIRNRYSVRKYDSKMIEDSKLNLVLDAARLAPTARDAQTFKLYVLKSKEAIEKIRNITKMAFDAPVVIMISGLLNEGLKSQFSGREYIPIDSGIIVDHMMLQAHALGLGTCCVGWFDPKVVAEAFNIPKTEEIILLLPIGYPAKDCEPGPMHSKRKSLNEIVKEI